MGRRPVRLDRQELEELSGAKFSWTDLQELVELVTIYSERFREPIPDFMIVDSKITADPRRVELEARRAFVEAVEGIWRDRCHSRTLGSTYNPITERYDGPLLRLLVKLFHAMNVSTSPSPATLHHDLEFLHTGRERHRGVRQSGP